MGSPLACSNGKYTACDKALEQLCLPCIRVTPIYPCPLDEHFQTNRQYWLRLVAWKYKTTTWTNISLSTVRSSIVHQNEIFSGNVQDIIHYNMLQDYTCDITLISLRGQWAKSHVKYANVDKHSGFGTPKPYLFVCKRISCTSMI